MKVVPKAEVIDRIGEVPFETLPQCNRATARLVGAAASNGDDRFLGLFEMTS